MIGKYFGTLKLIVWSAPIIFHVMGWPALTVISLGRNALMAVCCWPGSPANGPSIGSSEPGSVTFPSFAAASWVATRSAVAAFVSVWIWRLIVDWEGIAVPVGTISTSVRCCGPWT